METHVRSGTRDLFPGRPTEDEPCASNPASQAHDPTRPPGTYRETCETGETYGLEWVLTPDESDASCNEVPF